MTDGWHLVDDDVLRVRLERLLGERIVSLSPESASSNLVYAAQSESGAWFSVRVAHLDPSRLSAFWQRQQDVFGHSYRSRLDHAQQLLAFLADKAPFAVPTLVASTTYHDLPLHVFTWIDGDEWEPDEFPDSETVHLELGRFLGRTHAQTLAGMGVYGSQSDLDTATFLNRMSASFDEYIGRYWRDNADVVRFATARLPELTSSMPAPAPAVMMPDISGNQFVFAEDTIAGLVDIDSYVVGPREWELAVTEMCISRPDAFKAGYEESIPLPSFAPFRDYYRFAMFVTGPDEPEELEEFQQRRVHFP